MTRNRIVPFALLLGLIQPGPRENKRYAPGVGLVLEALPGGGRVELVEVEP